MKSGMDDLLIVLANADFNRNLQSENIDLNSPSVFISN